MDNTPAATRPDHERLPLARRSRLGAPMRGTVGAPFSPESMARIEAITTIGEGLPLLMAS